MNILEIAIISIVQSITELYPISSSGHLILAFELFDLKSTTYLLTLLHLGSAMALSVEFFPELLAILRNLKRDFTGTFFKFAAALTPAVIAGVLIEDLLESYFYFPLFVGFNLILWGVIYLVVERWYERKKSDNFSSSVSLKQSLLIGLAQILALIPGTSRSGVTTIAGMLTGVERKSALDFSFIIGVPLLYGAFLYEFVTSDSSDLSSGNQLLAVLITFVVSLLAVKLLRRFAHTRFFMVFGVYRIIVGLVIIGYFLILV